MILMIRLLEKQDIIQLKNRFNFDVNYLESLLDNMPEYMYVSIDDEISGFMVCLDDGEYISIKNINGYNLQFLRHLIFNANKDIAINNQIEGC